MEPERDEGAIEYKLLLSADNVDRLERLATQMKYRLEEGGGEAIYFLGVSDDGQVKGITEVELTRSVEILGKVAEVINAKVSILRRVEVNHGMYAAEILIRRTKEKLPITIHVAVLGHVNAGKTTLLGALITGRKDDGNGILRNAVARFLHEVVSGRTSAVGMRILGFDQEGRVVNHNMRDPLDEAEITLRSSKIIKIIDLAGHEKYLRTTLKGLMGYGTDYVMLTVGCDDGLSSMGREHLGLTSVLKIPMFVVVTKIDKYDKERVEKVVNEVKSVLKLPGINKLAYVVEEEGDLYNAFRSMRTNRVVPIFRVSNVTYEGIPLLLRFMNLLQSKKTPSESGLLAYIDEIYDVKGVGVVVLATLVRGSIQMNQEVYLGPSQEGQFVKVRVKGIQVNRVFVDRVQAKIIATFALQGIEKDSLRKGMVIIYRPSRGTTEFDARVFLLHHPTTIKEGYVATLHLVTIRQAVRFKNIEKKVLRAGDSSNVRMEFLYRPEYMENGQIFVFREGRTRGIGIVE
ncbi:elongation factor 1-alpha [Sulfolobales archaeon HS-7]|nr:elongation factor 1-alpha [Sulfolobales archaeon HS-7]